MMYDLLIKNGNLVTGDGSAASRMDIGIKADRLVAIGQSLTGGAVHTVDASGRYVCPGFIDMHSHSDITLLADPMGQSKIRQGVTSEVIGNCGLSPFPLCDDIRRKSLNFIDVPSVDWNWNSAEDYLKRLENVHPSINTLSLVGHGAIRAAVMGYENKKPNEQQMQAMREMLGDCFEAGVWGISTGLGYAPDFYSDEDELCALAEVVRDYGRIFSFHIRGERKTLFKAVAEAINVSRRTGANVEVSHLKCCDTMNYGRMGELLHLFDMAAEEHLPVHFDQYPYTAGSSYMGLFFPPWAHEGGMEKLMERLDNPKMRAKIVQDMTTGTENWSSILATAGGSNVMITSVAPGGNRSCEGKMVSDLAKECGETPVEFSIRMMQEENGLVEVVMFQQQEEDMKLAMQHPLGMFGSDGFAFDGDGIVSKGTPHPRSFGTFPRILAKYVRQEQVLSLEAAIQKMTYNTAKKLHLPQRGLIAPGYYADLVIFDYDTIADCAKYENPMQFPVGISQVIVNGQITVEQGQHTGMRAGRVLRF